MKKFRLYFDKDAEQNWLNKMSVQGWAFEKFFLGYYIFVPCKPKEFIYQIDLLDNWNGDKKDFSDFMEDSGVEVVNQWYRWVFLRKKASDGPFEMYTDIESKISQYKRIKNFFMIGFLLEIMCFCIEITTALYTKSLVFWLFTMFLGLVALILLQIVCKCKWKIKQLIHNQ